ncbi:hypothetical protein GE061_008654, partial [Apolygus lucorum]
MDFESDVSLKEWCKDKPLSILQLDPADRAVLRIADERDAIQKKTFTKWVNKHLKKQYINLYMTTTKAREELNDLQNNLHLKYSHKYHKIGDSITKMKGFVEDMKMRIPSEEQLKLLVPKGGWSGMITSSIPGVKKNEGIPSELLQKTMLYLHTKYSDATKLYTDGTKSAEGAAGAVWCEEHRFTSGARLHVLSSSYQAEVEGLTLALKHVSAHDKNKRVVIITDSKAALDALANLGQDDLPPLYLLRLTQLLRNRVQEGYTLHFQWAPSHLGVPGNEKVDRYVRQVSTMEDVPVGLRTNHKDCEQEIRSRLRREWSVDYESGTGA